MDRPETPRAADEVTTLLAFLEQQRAIVAWKCADLSPAALTTTLGKSTMTLGGLLKHLANTEDAWCSWRLHGHDRHAPWDTIDWAADPTWDWHSAATDTPERLHTLWEESVTRSRTLVTEALTDGGLDRLAHRPAPDGIRPSLRWILLHLIEEYARHAGHADLIRESIDGTTGE
jgi:uncharacterized damage-inducible protein DinB